MTISMLMSMAAMSSSIETAASCEHCVLRLVECSGLLLFGRTAAFRGPWALFLSLLEIIFSPS